MRQTERQHASIRQKIRVCRKKAEKNGVGGKDFG